MNNCNIPAKELAKVLEIELSQLIEVCDFFDNDPNDEWELIERVHFKWELYNSRYFSPCGAFEICKYLEWKNTRPFYKRFQRWLLQRDRRLRNLMIAKQVEASSRIPGQLTFQDGKAFLGPKACREVLGLGTRQDILIRTFTEIQLRETVEIEPLEINKDYLDGENEKRFLSGSGLAVAGKHLGVRLKSKHRKDWLKAVERAAPTAISRIEEDEARRQERINNAMSRAKRQAKGRCMLTGRRKRLDRIQLSVHHLYDKNSYPQFADMADNLIVIDQEVHQHFHMWMGGTNVPCTVSDLERYVEQFHDLLFPDENLEQATDTAIFLSRAKERLMPLVQNISGGQ